MTKIQTVRGMHDIWGDEARLYSHIIEAANKVARLNNFDYLQTPIVEFSALFERNLGETSDVVMKEIYRFPDRSEEANMLALRPEFTASVARFMIESGLYGQSMPQKFFSYGPLFRYDRPQKGRYRQFHQINFEMFGLPGGESDIECLRIAKQTVDAILLYDGWRYETLGKNIAPTLLINFLGDKDIRDRYCAVLRDYFQKYKDNMSPENVARIDDNPLRILDSKLDREIINSAPQITEQYTQEYKDYVQKVMSDLNKMGIVASHDSSLVRGLDYYNDMVFEFVIREQNGGSTTILGGGRYDKLISQISGETVAPLNAIGFAAGVERLMLLLRDKYDPQYKNINKVAIIPVGDTLQHCYDILRQLHEADIVGEISYYGGKLGSKIEKFERRGFTWVVFCGDDEIKKGQVKLKNLVTKKEDDVAFSIDPSLSKVAEAIKSYQ